MKTVQHIRECLDQDYDRQIPILRIVNLLFEINVTPIEVRKKLFIKDEEYPFAHWHIICRVVYNSTMVERIDLVKSKSSWIMIPFDGRVDHTTLRSPHSLPARTRCYQNLHANYLEALRQAKENEDRFHAKRTTKNHSLMEK